MGRYTRNKRRKEICIMLIWEFGCDSNPRYENSNLNSKNFQTFTLSFAKYFATNHNFLEFDWFSSSEKPSKFLEDLI